MTTIEKIFKLMQRENISGSQLQKVCELSNSAIAQWGAGKAKPGVEAIIKIAKYFNVSTDYLLGLTENEHEQKKPADIATDSQTERVQAMFNHYGITLEKFNNLPNEQKELIMKLAQNMVNSHKEQN